LPEKWRKASLKALHEKLIKEFRGRERNSGR